MISRQKDITDVTEEQKLFLREEDLTPGVFGIHRHQVMAGYKWLIYRDGLLVKQLGPGPHRWWNGFLHKWKAHIINTRVELLHIDVKGRVKGPPIPQEAPGASAVDLACEVTAELEISARISELENFLQYRDPLSVFLASLRNMVVEFIGKLHYDQYGEWATELRDQIRNNLQYGAYDSERRVGIRVEDVFVTEFKPSTTHDRNMLAMYQLVEKARRELVEARANSERDSVVASSYAEQGGILNIAPSILALQNSPVGKALIDRDASLREMTIAAGLNPGVNVQPINDPTGQLGGAPAVGYLNPPRPSIQTGQASGPLPGQAGQVSGQLYNLDEAPTGPIKPQAASPSTNSGGSPFDAARQDMEIAALQQAGFVVAGRGKIEPVYNTAGQPVPGSEEWVLPVYMRLPTGVLTIVFHCPTGYPVTAPAVQVKAATGGGLSWIQPNSVHQWIAGRLLVDVAQEIVATRPE